MEVGQSKMPNSEWQDSKCAYFSDLNTGNNTYKAVQRESIGYWAYVARVEQTRKRFKRDVVDDL
jgi:phosphotransacetylase